MQVLNRRDAVNELARICDLAFGRDEDSRFVLDYWNSATTKTILYLLEEFVGVKKFQFFEIGRSRCDVRSPQKKKKIFLKKKVRCTNR